MDMIVSLGVSKPNNSGGFRVCLTRGWLSRQNRKRMGNQPVGYDASVTVDKQIHAFYTFHDSFWFGRDKGLSRLTLPNFNSTSLS
jgi:hypothetical protein